MVLVEEESGGKVLGIVTLEDLVEELLQTVLSEKELPSVCSYLRVQEIRGEEEVVFLRSASGLMRTQSVRALRGTSDLAALAKRSQSTRCMGIERKKSLEADIANSKKTEEGGVPSSVPTRKCHEVCMPINEETPLLPVDNKSNTSAAPAPAGALGRQRTVSFFA